jgi:hypothetical protein
MQIRIGPIDYDVIEVKGLVSKEFACGECNYERGRIRIDAGMHSQVKQVTIWHEAIHAILHGAAIGDHDEQVVDALAHGIVQVLRDNAELRGVP